MKTKLNTVFALVLSSIAVLGQNAPAPAIIPAPVKMNLEEGVFSLGSKTYIVTDPSARETGEMLAARLRKSTSFPINVDARPEDASAIQDAILLTTNGASADLGEEGYELFVKPGAVVIRAPKAAGLFYGTQTLLQLLPS